MASLPLKDCDLPIVNGRDVGAGLDCEKSIRPRQRRPAPDVCYRDTPPRLLRPARAAIPRATAKRSIDAFQGGIPVYLSGALLPDPS